MKATIQIPGSKSISNRALLLAALAEGVSEIRNIQISEDIRVFVKALTALGVDIHLDEKTCCVQVRGAQRRFPHQKAMLFLGESGTLARFLPMACAAVSGAYSFDAAPSLRKRPIASLLNFLRSQGMDTDPAAAEQFPFSLYSRQGLPGGQIEVDASETGQMVSALLMTAPFTQKPCHIIAKNLVSHSYVELTCALMSEFGVNVDVLGPYEFSVLQPQHYQARIYQVEPDLSTACYFLAAAAVTAGEITIQYIDRRTTKQGDVIFLSILEQMGCAIQETPKSLTLKGPAHLQGLEELNLKSTPDLFPTIAAIAPFAKTPTLITGIAHARLKESDRLRSMQTGLEALGVQIEVGQDWFKIHPTQPQAATINPQNDHRIAMAFSVTALRTPGLRLTDTSCVAKSCPEFFELWGQLNK